MRTTGIRPVAERGTANVPSRETLSRVKVNDVSATAAGGMGALRVVGCACASVPMRLIDVESMSAQRAVLTRVTVISGKVVGLANMLTNSSEA
jgi:hypothetical protein